MSSINTTIELARLALMFPDAQVLVDIGQGDKPIRSIDLNATASASNDKNLVLVVSGVGYARAKRKRK